MSLDLVYGIKIFFLNGVGIFVPDLLDFCIS